MTVFINMFGAVHFKKKKKNCQQTWRTTAAATAAEESFRTPNNQRFEFQTNQFSKSQAKRRTWTLRVLYSRYFYQFAKFCFMLFILSNWRLIWFIQNGKLLNGAVQGWKTCAAKLKLCELHQQTVIKYWKVSSICRTKCQVSKYIWLARKIVLRFLHH